MLHYVDTQPRAKGSQVDTYVIGMVHKPFSVSIRVEPLEAKDICKVRRSMRTRLCSEKFPGPPTFTNFGYSARWL